MTKLFKLHISIILQYTHFTIYSQVLDFFEIPQAYIKSSAIYILVKIDAFSSNCLLKTRKLFKKNKLKY